MKRVLLALLAFAAFAGSAGAVDTRAPAADGMANCTGSPKTGDPS